MYASLYESSAKIQNCLHCHYLCKDEFKSSVCGPALNSHSDILVPFKISFLLIVLALLIVHCTCRLVPECIYCILSDPALKTDCLISGVLVMIGVNSSCPLRGSNYTLMYFSSHVWINDVYLKLIHFTVATYSQLPWLCRLQVTGISSQVQTLLFWSSKVWLLETNWFFFHRAPFRKYYHMQLGWCAAV